MSTTVTRSKPGTSFRFSDRTLELLPEVAEFYGVSKTGIIEILVRQCYRNPGCLQDRGARKAVERAREATTPLHLTGWRLSVEAFDILNELTNERAPELSQAEVIEICLWEEARRRGLV